MLCRGLAEVGIITCFTTSLPSYKIPFVVVDPESIPILYFIIFSYSISKNAAILAAKILAASDDAILEKIKAYTADMKSQVEAKDAKLQSVGYKQYLAEK